MASSIQGLVPAFSGLRSRRAPDSLWASTSSLSLAVPQGNYCKPDNGRKIPRKVDGYRVCKAMVQQAVQGASAIYAKDMERLSAKESLLLAFKDSGGFKALVTGKVTDMQRVDVNERIIGLERLNPTPRPTTSPFLEGQWSFEWFGSGSPGLFAATFLFERFPSSVANLSSMDVLIKDANANITATMRLLNSIESKFSLSTQLSVEGPLRMKEDYVEGVLELPTVDEETIPEQIRGAFRQAVNTIQQLPLPIRNAVGSGLKVPLSGTFQRLFMISYLDEEILIIRDIAGVPEVLTRLDYAPPSLPGSVNEYES